MKNLKRNVYLVFDGRGPFAEFYGSYQSRDLATAATEKANDSRDQLDLPNWYVECRPMTRDEIAQMLEDDAILTDDAIWLAYEPAPKGK